MNTFAPLSRSEIAANTILHLTRRMYSYYTHAHTHFSNMRTHTEANKPVLLSTKEGQW